MSRLLDGMVWLGGKIEWCFARVSYWFFEAGEKPLRWPKR
jgi:hypothetical protein